MRRTALLSAPTPPAPRIAGVAPDGAGTFGATAPGVLPAVPVALAASVAPIVLIVLIALTTMAPNARAAPEPLRAEEAFVPSARADTRDALTVRFAIEPGYYLYRDKLAFAPAEAGTSVPDAAVELGTPRLPPAITVEDAFFGTTATYRDALVVELPITVPDALASLALDVTWQGCADIGFCYPPTSTRLDVALPPAAEARAGAGDSPSAPARSFAPSSAPSSPLASSARSDDVSSLGSLFGELGADGPELLSPEEAFVPLLTRASSGRIEVLWRIEPGYYLYRDKFAFSLDGATDATLGTPALDAGNVQHDEFFGDVEVWRGEKRAVLPLASPAVPGSEATLEIAWQGCADIGVCFPPKRSTLAVAFDASGDDEGAAAGFGTGDPTGSALPGVDPTAGTSDATASTAGASAAAVTTGASTTPPLRSEQGRLAALLGSRGLWLNAATFLGFGLLLAFTPCVLPMIPILSSLIVGRGDTMTTGRAFRLSLIYVLVMASAYAALGVLVGLTGYNVQPLLQDPLVLSATAALFVVLALSMFGLFELQVPTALQQKLTGWSNEQRGGEVGGVVVMALLSTLIVGPCMTAPLMGALIYIADTGDARIGGVALFSLGLGMGIPLLLVGLSAGTLLPRAGAWMVRVKQLFGVVLLAMAIYMLSRFLPPSVIMALAGALALWSGVLFGATDTLNAQSSGGQRFAKGAGLVVAVYGLALLIGALAGGGSYTTPLGALAARGGGTAGEAVGEGGLAFRAVKGPDGLAAAVAEASAAGRPVMLDFYADWCISCKEMEAFTFTDPAVRNALGDTLVVQADVTANDAEDQALLEQFGLYGPPGIVFYDATGQELPGARVVGFVPAERFAEHVVRAIGERSI